MQVSRVSVRAFKAIAISSSKQARFITTTNPTTFSSLLTSDKPTGGNSYSPRLPASAVIPVPEATETGSKIRHFNTSRSLKAVADSSTIDFAYIPDFDPEARREPEKLRVPILPFTNASEATLLAATEVEEPVMIPHIHTIAADGTHIHAPSAMSDMTDSNQFDYQGLAQKAASTIVKPIEQGTGMLKQILGDLVDDILGPKSKSGKA